MIEKRELYKELKKHKVFSKYCLVVSQAYADGDDYRYLPRDRYESYYKSVFSTKTLEYLSDFIKYVRGWQLTPNNIKILP